MRRLCFQLADKEHAIDLTPKPSPPYSIIAEYYDSIMSHVNYRKWAKYVDSIVAREGKSRSDTLLDIGCGTGRFLHEMKRKGWEPAGCDISDTMLSVAARRCPDLHVYKDTLPNLESTQSVYQICTCLYDTMNYLPDLEAVETTVRRVGTILESRGLFIFDMVSEALCREYFQNYQDSERISEDVAYARETHYDAGSRTQYNWVRLFTSEGVFEEEHQQRIFRFSEIRKMLKGIDEFELCGVFADFSLTKATERHERAHFVLKKR